MMVAFSAVPTIQLRLPAGDDNTSLIYLVASIRDTLDCVKQSNISSVTVLPDSEKMAHLIETLQNPSSDKTKDPLVQILSSGNQNTIGQVISSLSQQFNKINNQTVENAVASKMNKFLIFVR